MKREGIVFVTVTCFVALILVPWGPATFAAEVLSRDEMGALQGGCQKYCWGYTCGTDRECLKMGDGSCYPEDPYYPCDGLYVVEQTVLNCGRLTPNGAPCTQGDATDCGTYADCYCRYIQQTGQYLCITQNEDHYLYYPCENP